jgi:hypothetical protein
MIDINTTSAALEKMKGTKCLNIESIITHFTKNLMLKLIVVVV